MPPMKTLKPARPRQPGQGLVEYAVILSLAAIIVAAAAVWTREAVQNVFLDRVVAPLAAPSPSYPPPVPPGQGPT
jgi:hypothetical protein